MSRCLRRTRGGLVVLSPGFEDTVADTHRLPQPITSAWDWQRHGACRGMDSAVFFHPELERGRKKARRDENAKQVCRSCPVLEQCRRHALSAEEPYGVWGGLSAEERQQILRAAGRDHRSVALG